MGEEKEGEINKKKLSETVTDVYDCHLFFTALLVRGC